MIGAATLLLPIIINNAMHAYDTPKEEHKSSNNTYTDDEIIYMRERMNRPWDGSCLVMPSDKITCRVTPPKETPANMVCICNAYHFIGENKYALKEDK